MPTDENNGVNPQNQQVSPSTSDSDDFDFNFDDSNNNQDTQAGTWLSWDMQDQMRRQWRSGMFLTPDEAITKSNEDNDMSLWNIDISSTVQPQQRSGMFLTPDEEANKEESQIEWKQYSFQWVDESQGVNDTDSDDSYLAWIDPEDVEDSQDWGFDNWQQETSVQDNDYSQDKLDDEIEDLISFWDEPKADNIDQWSAVDQTVAQPEDVNKEIEVQATPSVETVVEQPVDTVAQSEQSVEPGELKNEEQNNELIQNIQEWQDSQIVQDGVWNIWVENSNVDGEVITESKWWDSEDRLSQEDKKVEESFWTASESISSDIDVSPENVGQNVENVINEPVDTPEQNVGSDIIWNVNLDVNVQPVEQNDLHIENMWTDVVENWNWDLISDVWWMQQMNQENTYVPNEAEFNQMSDILNSSNAWQIDLSNLNSEQSVEQTNDQENPVQTIPVVENTQVETVVPTVQNNVSQSELENSVDDELSKFWGVDLGWQVISQEVQPSQEVQTPQEIQQNVVIENHNSEINLDSLMTGAEPVNQTVVLDNNTNSDTNNWSLIWSVNEWAVVEQSNQTVPQKKRKKQSWFKVLWIFAIVCILLWVGVYVASKMFPEEFSKIFNKNDPVVWYLLWNDVTNIDENNPDEENPDNIENSWDVVIENSWNVVIENSWGVVELPNEQPDPDSLAGLLEWDNNWEDLEFSWDVENIEVTNWDGNENIEGSWDWNETWNNTMWWDNSTWDFDPFAWIDEILWEAQEYIDRLNAYVASWQYYVNWWESNWNVKAKSVWGKVIEMAQGELTKLENWGEIDTTAFDRIDDLLKKLSDLAK